MNASIRRGASVFTLAQYNSWKASNVLKIGEFVFISDSDLYIIGKLNNKELHITHSEYLIWKRAGNSGTIEDFIDIITNKSKNASLVLSPVITGPTSGLVNSIVTLSASGSISVFDNIGATISKYIWIKPNGLIVEGDTINVQLSEGINKVGCKAIDSLGNISNIVYKNVTTVNQYPSGVNVTTTLPSVVTRGSTYTITISGGTDPDGNSVMYNISNVAGCTFSTLTGISNSTAITINNNTNSIAFDIRVMDNNGLTSLDVISVSRSGANVVQPTGSSGNLSSGTHVITIPIGVSNITIEGNGGGSAGGQVYNTTLTGSVTHTFPGSPSGTSTPPAATTLVKSVDPSKVDLITCNVATNGGTLKILW